MFSILTEFSTAQKLATQRFHVIFFAESSYYFQYFHHLYDALLKVPGIRIAYITSDKKDAILTDSRVTAVYLKTTLAGIFPRLQADVMIMTMPDLQHFIFKKSPGVKKYVYVFHALVSTHQQYRLHAFDHYDAIFCTGPQHEEEIRQSEKLYGLPQKDCIAYGYPLLANLQGKAALCSVDENKILIAPSWYSEGILNTCIRRLLEALLGEQKKVWIRPHPEFIKRNKKVYSQLEKMARNNAAIQIDTSPSVYTHLIDAGCLVTDRSGIALEYALATYRPVLFVDTPLKIQNPDVAKYSVAPLENEYRYHLGAGIQSDELENTGNMLQKLKRSAADYRTSIQAVADRLVYAPENWQNGVTYIKSRLTL